MKILFLLKERSSYGDQYSVLESGLLNSAKMTKEALVEELGIEADLRVTVDGNTIDKEVHQYKPDIVIIEAIWVTPAKFRELHALHPNVLFIIRVHSEIPFLAHEGNSVAWCKEYSRIPNVIVAFNSRRTKNDFNTVANEKFYYLPNIYEKIRFHGSLLEIFEGKKKLGHTINIGCFGAIRPMKNQLQQAVAAMSFANKYNVKLNFHINAPRIEQEGHSVLKNLRALFDNTKHTLVEHAWLPREQFLAIIDLMDCGMQVSLNESFNIVTADFVKMGVPIVVSRSISWMPDITKVDTEDTQDIINGLESAFANPRIFRRLSRKHLISYNNAALNTWYNFLYD